jgi:YhcH/YjgK/YiaL family protein
MIIDYLENIGTYRPILPGVEAGLRAVEALGEDPAVGRYEFEGGYFMVQEGETKAVADGDFEAHRKYIDVQIILKGQELVAWADTSLLAVSVPYDEAKDKIMYSGEPAQCNVI